MLRSWAGLLVFFVPFIIRSKVERGYFWGHFLSPGVSIWVFPKIVVPQNGW